MTDHRSQAIRDIEQLRVSMTMLLYSTRLEAYGVLGEITGKFLGPRLDDPSLIYSMPGYLRDIEDWHSRHGLLLLSELAYRSYQTFRDALSACIKTRGEDPAYSEAKKELWHAKNGLRTALRKDLHLMYGADPIQVESSASAGNLSSQ